MSAPILITGGAGFIGCNLADRLAREGHDVLIYDSLARAGVEENVAWLRATHPARVSAIIADIRDEAALSEAAARAGAVFHFAAQVAVTSSMDDPESDFSVNVRGTFALLEALRKSGARTPLIFASTNKVYGDLADIALAQNDGWRPVDAGYAHGISEQRPLDFHTPYGCSKGAADQYVLDYARSFGLPAVVLRMSCIYGARQRGTEDQGWVAHFLLRALARSPITLYGDGHQVRDILWIDDAVEAYVAALSRIGTVQGKVFNLGGGPANAVSLRTVIARIEELLQRRVIANVQPARMGDQCWFVADTRRAASGLGLSAPLPWREGLARLAAWFSSELGSRVAEAAE